MRIEIKLVKHCKDDAYGGFYIRGHQSVLITISLTKNTTMAEYGATILHELLHLWVTILRRKKFRCADSKEHDFIYAVERSIYKQAVKFLARRKSK